MSTKYNSIKWPNYSIGMESMEDGQKGARATMEYHKSNQEQHGVFFLGQQPFPSGLRTELKQQLQIEGQYRRLIQINKEIRNWIFRWNRLLVEHFKFYTFSVPCPPGWLLVIIKFSLSPARWFAQGHSKRDFLSELWKVINFLLCKFDLADKVKLRFNRVSKVFD